MPIVASKENYFEYTKIMEFEEIKLFHQLDFNTANGRNFVLKSKKMRLTLYCDIKALNTHSFVGESRSMIKKLSIHISENKVKIFGEKTSLLFSKS